MNDEEIIALFEGRSETAISETQKKYGGLCRYIASNILTDNCDVDECINDTYLAVWNAIPPEKPKKFSSFIGKIVRNLALKKYEYNTSKKRNTNISVTMSELDGIIPSTDDMVSNVENREIIKHINVFLRTLSFDDRNIFLRRYFMGDSTLQISTMFKFSESKVKSSLHRTRNKLKAYLIKKEAQL